ncbi:hypothetical protein M5E88_08680 [Akkermansia muciniphila]|nr:hypothetical protein M5E88_08680 [Akkermansia muciniphila]
MGHQPARHRVGRRHDGGLGGTPPALLRETSNRILNEVKGINRVLYDISTKPPASIEWE